MRLKRTHTCGELTAEHINQEVILNGWIATNRDHGGLIFIDLRDRYGKTQVTFSPEKVPEIAADAKRLGLEDVIAVKGVVSPRPKGNINSKMSTGEIELDVTELEVLSESAPLPFLVSNRESGSEELRLEYRYLELRTAEIQRSLAIRHKTYQATRSYLAERNFIEVETPVLMKSTPEGARDYLVPSRLHKGRFYALPQSPQTYKQLLMIGGFDRYFQIVKCFRDEDLRADRQPEFTQIDIEMSFVDQDDVLNLAQGLTRSIFKRVRGEELPEEFPRMSYQEAMETYGSDKPDVRFEMQLREFADFASESQFEGFKSVLANGGRVKAIVAENLADKYSRKVIDGLTDWVKTYYGVKGLAFMKAENGGLSGGISKFFTDEQLASIRKRWDVADNDILFFVADEDGERALQTLGALRLEIARRENLIPENIFKPLFVLDFPLLEFGPDAGRYVARHHPFTSPQLEDVPLMESDPAKVRARAYDLVINGYEVAGGSIRIHQQAMQQQMFKLLGMSAEEAERRFGFLLKAFQYGAPPHGGIAFGFDRLIMLLSGTENIRDVIAFPKTTSAMSLMDEAPSFVDEKQLKELHIRLSEDVKPAAE
ncbi:MAG: aspartate--tRNA ligase [Lentisphaeria bacterium]|nr:aspartate--tRNA ligase [Candidatus Neomarinimicrobiota bacterium]MCF7842429.1 aspartate--tRNA ligase [Lentisphaeria bacterium]